MPTTDYKPRLLIAVTPEQKQVLSTYLAYGEQRRVFQAILIDITMLLQEFGYDFVTFMLQREFSYRKLLEAQLANRRFAGEAFDQFRGE
jgi:hypothetical protein